MTILAIQCRTMAILADVCKRTCGLCNDNQLPLPPQQPPLPRPPQLPLTIPPILPPVPLPLGGKQLNTLSHLKTIDVNHISKIIIPMRYCPFNQFSTIVYRNLCRPYFTEREECKGYERWRLDCQCRG